MGGGRRSCHHNVPAEREREREREKTKILLLGSGKLFADFCFLRGVLERNPRGKRELSVPYLEDFSS